MSTKLIMDSQMLTSLMACPAMYELTFERDLVSVQGKAPALETGGLVHAIREHFAKARINGKKYSEAVAIGFEAGKEFCKPFSPINKYIIDPEHEGITNVPYETDDKRITSISFVFKRMEEYFDFWKNDSNTILAAEETKGRIIYEDSDLTILWKAKYDAIIDTPMSIMSMDTKTMKVQRDTQSLNNQFMGQCVIIGSRYVMIDKVGFQTSLPLDKVFQRELIQYSASRLNEWCNDIVPYYANMLIAYKQTGNWPMNFTQCENKYGTCRFKEIHEADVSIREQMIPVYFKKGKKWDIQND